MTDNGIYASVNNETFLQTIFKHDINTAHVCVFHDDPNQMQGDARKAWAGGHWGNFKGLFTQGGNQYYTISTFKLSPDGRDRRRKALFKQTYVIVVDDVGVGLSAKVDPNDSRLLPPSFALETSPGNCQYGYILTLPETVRARVDNLLDGMVSAGITEDFTDPGQKGVTRYVRLPEGTNNKQKYIDVLGYPFKCRMTLWNPLLTYTLDQLAEPFGIDLDAARQEQEGITIADDEHPALLAYAKHWAIKSKLAPDRYDVTCPLVHEHTDGDDSGTAIWTYPDGRLALKCHHSHGADIGGGWLMKELFKLEPQLSEQVAWYGSLLHKVPGAESDNGTVAPQMPDLHTQCMGLMHDSDFNTVIVPLLQIIAQLSMSSERDPYIQTIADQTGRRVGCLRTDVQRMIRSSQRSLIANGVEPAWVHTNENGLPLSTIENFIAMMTFYRIRSRYNEMTKSLEIDIPGEIFRTDTAKNAQLLRIESYMIQHGMNPNQTVGWCNYAAQYDNYHPLREYLDMRGSWDGLDRIQMLSDTLIADPTKTELKEILLRRWLVSVCAAALRDTDTFMSDTGEHAPAPRGVFTLQGPQYMGKTRWFRCISPPTMFKEGLQLGHDKDSVKQSTNSLIVEIGEADTSTKQDAGRVKAFISRDYDELRVPWDRAESRWPRRTVFGGSVNPRKFLMDSTGNSRWWTVAITDINFSLLSLIDIHQMWLQVEQLWLAGEQYLLTDFEMAMLNDSNIASQVDTPFEEFLLDYYDWSDDALDKKYWLTTSDLRRICKDRGVPVPHSSTVVREILMRLTKRNNFVGRMNKITGRFWKLPKAALHISENPE